VKGTVDADKLSSPLVRRPEAAEPPQTVKHRTVAGGLDESEERLREIRTAYAEQIVFIDMQIGRILKHLEDLGIFEETSILFSADHGDMLGDFGLNAKGPFPYPAQLDIPLIVANHPSVPTGARSLALAGNIDLPGTVLDIAGADRPIGYSRSLVQLATASGGAGDDAGTAGTADPASGGGAGGDASRRPAAPLEREVIFSEFCDSVKTVDDGRFRFSYYPFQGARELYDRAADPDCYENLAGRPEVAEVEARMLAHIVDFMTLAKGVRVEAHDFVPDQQKGLEAKYPDYRRDFPVAFPLTRHAVELLEAAGCDATYNEFCRGKEIVRYYGKPYWMEE
jgi:arylsulfatase A-like enzyme